MNEATDDFHFALLQLEQSIAELRNTSHNLFPEIVRREGLVTAIHIYCQEISRMPSCTVTFQVLGSLPGLKQEFQLAVYRIVQELLQNIVKHSSATDALLQFNAGPGILDITMDDNGCGLTSTSLPGTHGVGLSNIHQRVTALRGRMEIQSGEGRGDFRISELRSGRQYRKNMSIKLVISDNHPVIVMGLIDIAQLKRTRSRHNPEYLMIRAETNA